MKRKNMPKYGVGGLLKTLGPLASLLPIPGAGIAGSLLAGIGGLMDEQPMEKPVPIAQKYTNNPYNGMRKGGEVNPNGFKQYDTKSHENGGQAINKKGEIDIANPAAEIETTENKYTYSQLPGKKDKTYVFSEKNGTASKVKTIVEKYKNKNVDKDFLARTAMEMEIKTIENKNESIKIKQEEQDAVQQQMQEPTKPQMAGGGRLNISTLRHERYHQKLQGNFDNILRKGSQENLEELPYGGLTNPNMFKGLSDYIKQKPLTSNNMMLGSNSYPYTDLPQNTNLNNPVQLGLNMDYNGVQANNFINNPKQLIDKNYMNVSNNSKVTSNDNGVYDSSTPLLFDTTNTAKVNNNFKLPAGTISNIIGTGLSAFDTIKALTVKADKVDPRLTDYSRSDEKMYGVNTDMTEMKNAAQNAANQATQQINDGSSSQAQRQARLSGVYSNLGSTLANVSLQEQQQKNQQLMQQGQYEAGKAQDNSNKLLGADERYAQNQAATRGYGDAARQTLNSFAAEMANKQAAQDQTKHAFTQARLKTQDGFALLNKLAENFGVTGSEEWNKYLTNPSPENLTKLETSIKLKIK